jgi:hypothetical protein
VEKGVTDKVYKVLEYCLSMRGSICLGAIFFVFLCSVGAVGAAGCANNDQIIMRLSSSENAHGAIWDQAYGVKICYDDFFGVFERMNAHGCSDESTALKLYTATNSHAASAASQNYQINICHRGLKNCTIRQGEGCTSSGERAIVYLSSSTNAHLSRSYLPGFYAVCCENASAPNHPPEINYCADYTSLPTCNADAYGVSANGCPSGKVCHCAWNATGNICIQTYNNHIDGCSYKCSLKANYAGAACNEQGFRQVNIEATRYVISGNCDSNVDSGCQSRQVSVPCGLTEVELPFFGLWQAAVSFLCITIVYLFCCRRKFFKE